MLLLPAGTLEDVADGGEMGDMVVEVPRGGDVAVAILETVQKEAFDDADKVLDPLVERVKIELILLLMNWVRLS